MEERLKADFLEALEAAEEALAKLIGHYEDEELEHKFEAAEDVWLELQDLGKLATEWLNA